MKKILFISFLTIMPLSVAISDNSKGIQYLNGSWNLTCDEIDTTNLKGMGILRAKCRRRKNSQGHKWSIVHLSTCTKPIENIDGTLVCK